MAPTATVVFSGSAVLDNGKPTVIYTGVAPPASDAEATLRDGAHTWRETQCLAVAQDDDLRTWKKLPEPVIAAPPAGLAVTGFRDPCLWREGNQWMLILGSGIPARRRHHPSLHFIRSAPLDLSPSARRRTRAGNSRAPTPSTPERCGSAPTSSRSATSTFC